MGCPATGVRPWPGALPDDPGHVPDRLHDGDSRNVVDAYRFWTRNAIIADIDPRRHPLISAIENFGHDTNDGSVVRTADELCQHDSTAELMQFAAAAGLALVAVDDVAGAARLGETLLPRECLLVFGQEGPGITDHTRAGATVIVSTAQFGSTRSTNAVVAAGMPCAPGSANTVT